MDASRLSGEAAPGSSLYGSSRYDDGCEVYTALAALLSTSAFCPTLELDDSSGGAFLEAYLAGRVERGEEASV